MVAEKVWKFEPDREAPNVADKTPAANDNRLVTATAWKWIDPAAIPPRDWLYGYHYIRKYVSVTVSPGGLGKTSKGIVEALSMATGRELLGDAVHERARVWLINEDPRVELDRRIAAACKHYGIGPADLDGWLFVDSFRDEQFKKDGFLTAKQTKDGTAIVAPFKEGLTAEIKRKGIDAIIVDPFVSTHAVNENDNMAIDLVIKQFWAPVIEATNVAAELIHHSKKLGGTEVTAESARGAVALIGAARSAMALNGMTVDEANKANVDNRHVYFRATDAKANMAPRSEKSRWFRIESVDLCNATPDRPSDRVGVVTTWQWPDTMAGITADDLLAVQREIHAGAWKDSVQASEWAGRAVAKALDLDIEDSAAKEKVKACLKAWKASGALRVERLEDTDRKVRPFVVVGEWATQPTGE